MENTLIKLKKELDNNRNPEEKTIDFIDFDEINQLCQEIENNKKYANRELTSINRTGWLYNQYNLIRRGDSLNKVHPSFIDIILPLHQNEFLARLRNVTDTDLTNLEYNPRLIDNSQETDIECLIEKEMEIIETKIIKALSEIILENIEKKPLEKYFSQKLNLQQLYDLRTMLDGILMCSDRQFFDFFSKPEIGDRFFQLKNRTSKIINKSKEKIKETSIREILPVEKIKKIIEETKCSQVDIKYTYTEIRDILSNIIRTEIPNNPDQERIFQDILADILQVITEDKNIDHENKRKILLLKLPHIYQQWLDYKNICQRNNNYTSSGVTNISLADNMITTDWKDEDFITAQSVLNDQQISRHNCSDGISYFLNEIKVIYESRKSISSIKESLQPHSQILSPAEAMKEISELTWCMNQHNLEKVLEIVERLEKKEIEMFHVTSDREAYDQILEKGELLSGWSQKRYADTFFGGGLYFWGAQQEDWLKGGNESIHIIYPAKDLFMIKNKYNNTKRNPFSGPARWMSFDRNPYPHSQKKHNIVCMIPAWALKINSSHLSENFPRNNEGYSAPTITTIDQHCTQEANFIWRINKHYGHYDTEFQIDQTKEDLIKKYFGNSVRIEKSVTTPGYIMGEYDRLIIPRDISILKATSLAYALRLPEVIYEDQIDNLHLEEKNDWRHLLQTTQEETDYYLQQKNQESVEIIDNLLGNKNLNQTDKIFIGNFLARLDENLITDLGSEINSLQQTIGNNLPNLDLINTYLPDKKWFNKDSHIHGTTHTTRVLILTEILGQLHNHYYQSKANLKAMRIAASLHDTQRINDRAQDISHGQKAAEWLLNNCQIYPTANPEERKMAAKIMTNHSIADNESFSDESKLFKDADALDRYRFFNGPDWNFIRNQDLAKRIDHISYVLANLSSWLLANGYHRNEATIVSAQTLQLIK